MQYYVEYVQYAHYYYDSSCYSSVHQSGASKQLNIPTAYITVYLGSDFLWYIDHNMRLHLTRTTYVRSNTQISPYHLHET